MANTVHNVCMGFAQCGKMKNLLSSKNISSNQPFSNFFSKNIAFTNFCQKSVRVNFRFHHASHCVLVIIYKIEDYVST